MSLVESGSWVSVVPLPYWVRSKSPGLQGSKGGTVDPAFADTEQILEEETYPKWTPMGSLARNEKKQNKTVPGKITKVIFCHLPNKCAKWDCYRSASPAHREEMETWADEKVNSTKL